MGMVSLGIYIADKIHLLCPLQPLYLSVKMSAAVPRTHLSLASIVVGNSRFVFKEKLLKNSSIIFTMKWLKFNRK